MEPVQTIRKEKGEKRGNEGIERGKSQRDETCKAEEHELQRVLEKRREGVELKQKNKR